jgi:3-phenylpropionate/trans-cinnamate dioxygenase ferredoxin reductase subunit
MSAEQTYVIAGASLAGAKAAETLRAEGFDGRLVLVGAEEERPYERPPLSKEYLRGEAGREKVYVHEEGFYEEHEIELLLGRRALALDLSGSELALDGGDRLRYDKLLLATGAEPRRLSVPGAELDGVLYLRSVGDSDALRERLDRGGTVVVVGAGWIGAEVAASARQRGLDVTVLDPLAVPLERVLGAEVGAIYRDIHADHGTRVLMGTGVEAFEGGTAVERVRTSDGSELECDLVVVGVGVEPRTELAAQAGLTLDNGIAVDERLRTSSPAVFAAGDVANAQHPFYGERIRVEHWANALNQGPRRRPQHAGRRRRVRPAALLLLGSVRRGHGVLGLRPGLGPRRHPGRSDEPGVHRLLHARGPRRCRHERERVGRDRSDPGADPRARFGRRPASGGHGHPADGACRCRYDAAIGPGQG